MGQPEYLWKLEELKKAEVMSEQTGIRLIEFVKVCSLAHMCVSSYHRDSRWFLPDTLSARSVSNKTCRLINTTRF